MLCPMTSKTEAKINQPSTILSALADYLQSCSLVLRSASVMPHTNKATQSAADTMTTYQGSIEPFSRPALIGLSCTITALIVAAIAVIIWRTQGQSSCQDSKRLAHQGLLPDAHSGTIQSGVSMTFK